MKEILKKTFFVFVAIAATVALGWLLIFASKAISRQIYPHKYAETVEQCAKEYEIPAEIIYAVIQTESGFRQNAKSDAGAIGLMQLMPSTFAWINMLREETKDPALIWDVETNIEYGSYLLRYLYDHYQNWDTAFAAYNAGMNRVNNWLQDQDISENGILVRIPYQETERYVEKVNHAIDMYRLLYPTETNS